MTHHRSASRLSPRHRLSAYGRSRAGSGTGRSDARVGGLTVLLTLFLGATLLLPGCGDETPTPLPLSAPPVPPAPETKTVPRALPTPTHLHAWTAGTDFIEWNWTPVADYGTVSYVVQVRVDERFDQDPWGEFTAWTDRSSYREKDLEPGTTRYLRVAAAWVGDVGDGNPKAILRSSFTRPVAGTSRVFPAPPIDLVGSTTGEGFIEWSWKPPEDATAGASGTNRAYEIQWAFWEDEVGARESIRTADLRYRLRTEPGTSAWLRVRRAFSPPAIESSWTAPVEGSSLAAPCAVPEVFATRPVGGSSSERARTRVSVERPAEARRPIVRILNPYEWPEPQLAARILSWDPLSPGSLARDELSFDWSTDGEVVGRDRDLRLQIAAAGCPAEVHVRCSGSECAVEP